MRLRRVVGAIAAVLSASALGSALVLLAGFVYQAVTAESVDALIGWAVVLVVVAVGLFALFGGMLPDEPESAGDGEEPALTAEPAEEETNGDGFYALVVVLGVLGLVAGGAVGIGGYEALRPSTATRPEAEASGPPSAGPSSSPSSSASGTSGGRAAVAWKVPPVGGPYDTGPGAWGLGDTAVQVRLDGLSAYDVRDGAVRWNVPAPARETVCAMGPDVEGNVGIVAFGRHEKPCATLAAVHTSTGKVLWRQPVRGAGLAPYGLAVGGSTAVAAEDRVVRGRSTETGEQRWQRPLGQGCAVRALDADAARALLVEQCGSGARLVALETRTGRERWARALPVESEVAAAVLSVTPAVVAVDEEDTRGTHALLAFDDGGTPAPTVPITGPAGALVVPEQVSRTGDWARPVVVGELLIALASSGSSGADKVVALSLKDGRTVWEHRPDRADIEALTLEPDGRLGILVRGAGAEVVLLDAATGAVRGGIATDDRAAAVGTRPELLPATGGHVIVNRVASPPQPSVFALR